MGDLEILCIKEKACGYKKRIRMCFDHSNDNESSIIDGFC